MFQSIIWMKSHPLCVLSLVLRSPIGLCLAAMVILLTPWHLGWPGLVVQSAHGAESPDRQVRQRLGLDGVWQFRTDPKKEGLAGRWYEADVPFPDKINVPGNWQAQGIGPSRAHLRHDYQGKAWYRRGVEVPADWAGKRIWIHLGGTANTADVYVNGKNVGFVEGFVTPYEFDITEAVRPGVVNTIACCVDSTGTAPIGLFNFIGRWGGLYRGVYLEARPEVTIDNVFVIPDVKNKTAQTRIIVGRRTAASSWKGELLVRITPAGGGTALEGRSAVNLAVDQRESDQVQVGVELPQLRPWSPEDPFLYTVEVSLSSAGSLIDRIQDRFGMRQFTVGAGGTLLLNGRPYFVRGLVDDTVEVLTGTQHPDKQIYVHRLGLIKRYGFNAVRFLGNTPIKEYFEAADEVGVLIMAEGQVYHKPKPAIPLLKEQVARIAKAYRNHPSWYAFSAGNEHFECQGPKPDRQWMDYLLDAHRTFKRLDPSRFFLASDGADVFPTDIITQAGKVGAKTVGGSVDYQQLPHIWHEFPNTYVMPLPDGTITQKWTGVFQDDRRVSWFNQQIADLGLAERYPAIRRRSVDLFYLYLKQVYESARHSPTLDGYGYWLMADWIGANEGDACFAGIFSSLYEPDKFPEPGPILQFNSPTVILADAGVDRRVFVAGESRPVTITVSHYGAQQITGGRLSWKACVGNRVLQEGALDSIELNCGAVRPIGTITLGPFQLNAGRRIRLQARLESKAVVQENHWDFWVFPTGQTGLQGKPILNRTGQKLLDQRYAIDPKRDSDQARLVLANRLTPEVLNDLACGRTVLLLAEQGALVRPCPFSFWAEWIRSTGTFLEDHPALAHFPHDGFCAYQFYRLFGGHLETINLTERGTPEREKLTPIVWGVNQDYDPKTGLTWSHPQHRWKVYRQGILCEGRIGSGRIMVCCLRLLHGVTNRQPEAGYLLDCLVEYSLSDRSVENSMSMTVDEARQVFKFQASSSHP